jgi:hypothetical protein
MQRPLAARFDGQVAGGAVADSFFMISGFRGDDGARAVGAAAVVAVPGERSEPRGHRQRLANSAALTGARINRFSCPHARARRRRFQQALTPTDLHRPTCTGRRCGCWPMSTFLFGGIVVRRFWGGRWSSGDRPPMLMSASPGWAATMVPAPVERVELRGHRQRSPNSPAPTVVALSRALSALRPLLLGKISGICQD